MIIKLLKIVLYCNIELGYILKSIIVLTLFFPPNELLVIVLVYDN